MFDQLKQTAEHVSENLKDAAQERRTDKHLRDLQHSVEALGSRLTRLDRRVAASQRRFPWGLLLLAGVGYLVVNKNARGKVLGLIGQVSPSARDTVERVAGRVGDAVDDVQHGKNVGDAASDAARGIGHDVQANAKDVQREVGNKVAQVQNEVQDRIDDTRDNLTRS